MLMMLSSAVSHCLTILHLQESQAALTSMQKLLESAQVHETALKAQLQQANRDAGDTLQVATLRQYARTSVCPSTSDLISAAALCCGYVQLV